MALINTDFLTLATLMLAGGFGGYTYWVVARTMRQARAKAKAPRR